MQEATTPPAYSRALQYTAAVVLQVPAVVLALPPSHTAGTAATSTIMHHVGLAPSLPLPLPPLPCRTPCVRLALRASLPPFVSCPPSIQFALRTGPSTPAGFFFPSHQHGQVYDSSRCMYRARRPPETAETRSRSCSVLRPSPALASQIVNTRPLRSPALLSWHRFPCPGKLRCVLREGVIPTMPRTHGFG